MLFALLALGFSYLFINWANVNMPSLYVTVFGVMNSLATFIILTGLIAKVASKNKFAKQIPFTFVTLGNLNKQSFPGIPLANWQVFALIGWVMTLFFAGSVLSGAQFNVMSAVTTPHLAVSSSTGAVQGSLTDIFISTFGVAISEDLATSACLFPSLIGLMLTIGIIPTLFFLAIFVYFVSDATIQGIALLVVVGCVLYMVLSRFAKADKAVVKQGTIALIAIFLIAAVADAGYFAVMHHNAYYQSSKDMLPEYAATFCSTRQLCCGGGCTHAEAEQIAGEAMISAGSWRFVQDSTVAVTGSIAPTLIAHMGQDGLVGMRDMQNRGSKLPIWYGIVPALGFTLMLYVMSYIERKGLKAI